MVRRPDIHTMKWKQTHGPENNIYTFTVMCDCGWEEKFEVDKLDVGEAKVNPFRLIGGKISAAHNAHLEELF